MLPRSIRSGETLGSPRGDVVVVLAAGGRPEQWLPSLASVLRNTPDRVRVLVHGWGADPEAAAPGSLESLLGPEGDERLIRLVAAEENGPAGVAEAVAAAAPADLAIVSLGCMVVPDWLPRLRIAAGDDAAIATASAMPATLIGLPGGGRDPNSLAEAAAAAADASLRLHPRVQGAIGGCVYVPRRTIELVGSPDAPVFETRCAELGLSHVLADDVLVGDSGAAAVGANGRAGLQPLPFGSVDRAVGAVRRAVRGLAVVIDARVLSGPMNGTRLHVVELIEAVASTGAARVTAVVPSVLDLQTRRRLGRIAGLRLASTLPDGSAPPGVRGDVVHRPHQISNSADFPVLAELGDRLVITHQDLISFHTPSYFGSPDDWYVYRDLTRRALSAADRVVFFSDHVRAQALAEDLVEPARATVVKLGADHGRAEVMVATPPPAAEALAEGAETILCLGTDYSHKNRVFALRMAAELQESHGWTGRLVFAGPRVRHGSSSEHERSILAHSPSLAPAVLDLGEVSEEQKEWLLRRARLVVYPTVEEGFGLIPYEAAAHDVPCLWAPTTALAELLPVAAAGIVPWDPVASAKVAARLLRDNRARAHNLNEIRKAATGLTWEATAARLVEIYAQVCAEPASPAGTLERAVGLMRSGISEDAMRLVGPGGALPREAERPLLALLARPKLSGPLIDAMRVGYRVSHRRPRPDQRALPPGN